MRSNVNILTVLVVLLCLIYSCNEKPPSEGAENHIGQKVKKFDKVPKAARIKGRYLQEIEMTADPETGLVPKGRLDLPRKI